MNHRNYQQIMDNKLSSTKMMQTNDDKALPKFANIRGSEKVLRKQL